MYELQEVYKECEVQEVWKGYEVYEVKEVLQGQEGS